MSGKRLQASSPLLMNIARSGYERSHETPREALVTILFSAAALEGYINELTELTEFLVRERDHGVWSSMSTILKEAEKSRASTTLKFLLLSVALTGKIPEKGSPTYQDFDLLLRVRNAVVHLRAEIASTDEPELDKVVKALVGKGLVAKPSTNREGALVEALSNPFVARWAFNTAVAIVNEIKGMFPKDLMRVMLEIHWEDIQPIA